MHAAVIAINEAIDRQIPEDTLDTLKISSAHLINIYPELSDMYQQLLFDAKEIKAENARNKVNVTSIVIPCINITVLHDEVAEFVWLLTL